MTFRGRWNHNTSRIETLIRTLQNSGYNVQLKHVQEEKSNGSVSLFYNGNEIGTIPDYQSNGAYDKQASTAQQLVSQLKSA